MSDITQKLQAPEHPSTGRARATLKQLERRFGVQGELDPKKPPELLFVESMSEREMWKRLPDGSKGWDTNYELLEKTPVKGKGDE